MKRSLGTAVLAAGVLLVAAGCSSDSGGSGSAASSTAAPATSSASVSSESMTSGPMTSESMASESMTSASMTSEPSSSDSSGSESSSGASVSGSSGSTDPSVVPANLDAQSKTWFTTLCDGVAPIGQLQNLDTAGQDAAAAQKTGVQALQQFATVLSDTSARLKSTPPPTFEGGTDFANQMVSGLSESGPKLAALAKSFGTINPSNTAALQQAVSGLSGELSSAIAPLQSLTQLPPDVSAAAQQIPACKSLNG